MTRSTVIKRQGRNRSRGSKLRATMGKQKAYLIQPQAQMSAGSAYSMPDARMRIDPIRNGVRVINREIIQTINRTATTGNVAVGTDSIAFMFVNSATPVPSPGAGDIGSNKWIGQYATLYDKFRVKKLLFEFKPSQPVTAIGQVGMYFDADTSPVAPTTFDQISGNVYAQSAHVSQSQTLVVRPNQLNRLPQYVTSASSTESGAARVGVIQFVNTPVATTTSITGPVSLGVLWMEYEVEFLNPSAPTSASPATLTSSQSTKLAKDVSAELRTAYDGWIAQMDINLPTGTIDKLNSTITQHTIDTVLTKLRHVEL